MLLFVAIVALWVRSMWRQDQLIWDAYDAAGHRSVWRASSAYGEFEWLTASGPIAFGGSRPGSIAYVTDPIRNKQHMSQWRRPSTDCAFALLDASWWTGDFGPGPAVPGASYIPYSAIIVPIWMPLAILSVLLYVQRRRWLPHRRPEGACAVCGYDLRATPDRCPECGAIPAAAQSRAR